ncbi:VOC family protein [Aeromonas veronii]|uniref:VOC family protein n=1 Tax=Aeromonas veronii TaxID=654 RepID=UPI003B9F1147
MKIDHVGIQLKNLEGAIDWYKYIFNCQVEWELSSFSELTRSRLPGIVKLVELSADSVKLHLFEREVNDGGNSSSQFQHVAIELASKHCIESIRERVKSCGVDNSYKSLSEIVVDNGGVASCYFQDPEGNEFELVSYENKIK